MIRRPLAHALRRLADALDPPLTTALAAAATTLLPPDEAAAWLAERMQTPRVAWWPAPPSPAGPSEADLERLRAATAWLAERIAAASPPAPPEPPPAGQVRVPFPPRVGEDRLAELGALVDRERPLLGPGVVLLGGADDPAPAYVSWASLSEIDERAMPVLARLRVAVRQAVRQGADLGRHLVVAQVGDDMVAVAVYAAERPSSTPVAAA